MFGGAGTMVALYVAGGVFGLGAAHKIGPVTKFRPYFLLDLDPLLWGLAVSLLAGLVVSLYTRPPEAALVSKMFDAEAKPVS
jgi:hypothetical protein